MQKSFNQWVFACDFRISHPFQLRNEMTYSSDISRRDICESIRFILAFLLCVNNLKWKSIPTRFSQLQFMCCWFDQNRWLWLRMEKQSAQKVFGGTSGPPPIYGWSWPHWYTHSQFNCRIPVVQWSATIAIRRNKKIMFSECVDWTIKWPDASQTINTILSLTRVIKFHTLFGR